MGREGVYKPGSFYRICERTGFAVRAERTKKEWTNRIVRDRSFEMRQPQDFVRGRADPQNVPEPRPRTPNRFVSSTVTLPNLIASGDEQAQGWPGTLTGGATISGIAPDQALKLVGGASSAGVYEIPTSEDVDAGSIKNLQIYTTLGFIGLPNGQTPPAGSANPANLVTTVGTAFVEAHVEMALATVAGNWGPWFPASNSVFTAEFVKFRVFFSTFDVNTTAFVTSFSWQVGAA